MSDIRASNKSVLSNAQPFFADLTPIDLTQEVSRERASTLGKPVSPPPSVLKPPTQDEIEAIRIAAKTDAYKEGLAQGYAAGLAQATQDEAAQNAAFVELLSSFRTALDLQSELLPKEVLKLSLEIAQAMLCTQLDAKPEILLPLIKEAICKLPNLTNPLHIVVSPSDAVMVRKKMHDTLHENGWIVVEDPRMTPGGCVIDSPINSIDATLENRWKRLCQALGTQGEWLDSSHHDDA